MKIAIANTSRQGLGGGWSFIDNLKLGMPKSVDFVEWKDADVVLVPSASMIQREEFKEIKKKKKIVLRVDNALRNSRNRNTGMTRLYEFAQDADLVVYQSEWARGYLKPFIKKDGPVIYNGTDLTIFKREGSYKNFGGKPVYLYSRYSRDESKSWIRAWYQYQFIQRQKPEAKLIIVGKFSGENAKYNFDFFNGEKYEYLGVVQDKLQMAQVYRGCDFLLAPYYCDAASNTYIEAMATGVRLREVDLSGGTPEILRRWREKGRSYFSNQRMAREYLRLFQEV